MQCFPLIWSLIWMHSLAGNELTTIGYFPTYEECKDQQTLLFEESSYVNRFACVQREGK